VKAIQFYDEGDELYADMMAAIESAQVSVEIESYIFADDVVGRSFIDLLIKKVAQGVSARLIIDSVGSVRWKNRKYFKTLAAKGVNVHWFNPWSWREPLKFNRRNHRKVMVVDQTITFIGGFNFHRESSYQHYGQQRWKDAHICFRGSLSRQLSNQFNLIWRGHARWLHPIESDNGLTEILPNYSRVCRHRLRYKYLQLISDAQHNIQMTTPYFVPDHKMVAGLLKAAIKGVKVSIIVPKYSDHVLLKHAAYWYYRRLLKGGIHIYEFTTRMIHSKTMLIDNQLAVIGSANMDYRSFFINNEVMLFSQEKQLVEYLLKDINNSLKQSERVLLKELSTRLRFSPLYTLLGYLLRKWL
jgi:cardiolipin synthase